MTDVDNEELEPAFDDGEVEAPGGEPDVLLDVSQLSVDEITLEVEDLHARVSLQADVLELLNLHVGVDAQLGRVKLTIKGVEAKALLKVRLDNVARILERVMTTIDSNPDIVERLLDAVPETVEEVGRGAGTAVGGLVGEVGPSVADAVDDVGEGAGDAIGDAAGAALPQPPAEDAPQRRRRQEPDSTRTRRPKGSRGRRSEEG